MKDIYTKIWELAKPYYLKGRPMDIEHIQWMMEEALRISTVENLDDSLLLPLVILHDVGYSTIEGVASKNYYNVDIRKLHMEAGAKLAGTILEQVGYPENKIKHAVYYVSIHDQWAYGEVDMYTHDPILGTFKDLDFLWIYTPIGCAAIQKVLRKNNQEMLEYLRAESSPIYGKKPFSNPSTKDLYHQYVGERIIALS